MATEKDATLGGLTFEEVRDIAAAGLPIDQIKDLAKAGFSAEQLLELAGSMPKGGAAGGFTRDDIERLIKSGSDGKYRQNMQHPGISAFSHPEGDVKRPKAALRPTWVNGHLENPEQLSPAEIDAYNSITRSCSARNGQWTATVKRNGSKEELHIILPTGVDTRPNEPIPVICRELKDGPAAVDPISLAQRVAELEAKLAASAA